MTRGRTTNGRGPNGRGTIFQDKHGQWWAQLPKGEDNKRPKASAVSEAEAVLKLAELEKRRGQGLNIGDSRQTLAQFLRTWLAEVVRVERRATTAEDYTYIVEHYIIPHLGHIRLCDLNAMHVRRWLNRLKSQKVVLTKPKKPRKNATPAAPRLLAAGTRQNAYRRLYTALECARQAKLIAENPAALVDAPASEGREMHPLTAGQARTLLSTLAGDRLYALYLIELTLGLRLGELLGLRWVDLNWDKRELKITQTVQTVHNRTVIGEPKTKKSRRTVPVNSEIIAALQVRQQLHAEEKRVQGAEWHEHGLIFPSEVGTPIGPRNMLRSFTRLLKRAELPKIRFHDLRHTAASLMLAAGTPITDVSELLGHSSPAITARIYAHAYEEHKRSAVETMGRLLQKVTV